MKFCPFIQLLGLILHAVPTASSRWMTISFPSTLHLAPVLDILLGKVPETWRPEIRLGLQEALVNAAKHGNCLDPLKAISIRFRITDAAYCWIITDQGPGFGSPDPSMASLPTGNGLAFPESSCSNASTDLERDCGRGLYILHCIFDQVEWRDGGKALVLLKYMNDAKTWRRAFSPWSNLRRLGFSSPHRTSIETQSHYGSHEGSADVPKDPMDRQTRFFAQI